MQTQQQAAAYHENVLDHYENPRNVGSLDKKQKNVGTGKTPIPLLAVEVPPGISFVHSLDSRSGRRTGLWRRDEVADRGGR